MKKGFTLIELIAVIAILASTITLIIIRVEKNIEDANEFSDSSKISMIESAALIYATENTLTNLNSKNVDVITLQTLITKGLITEKSISGINAYNLVLVANVENNIKVKYLNSTASKSVIFIKGFNSISIRKNDSYTDAGAYVAIPNVGVSYITGVSNLNTSVSGSYTISYSYSNAESVTRKIIVN